MRGQRHRSTAKHRALQPARRSYLWIVAAQMSNRNMPPQPGYHHGRHVTSPVVSYHEQCSWPLVVLRGNSGRRRLEVPLQDSHASEQSNAVVYVTACAVAAVRGATVCPFRDPCVEVRLRTVP